MIKRNSKIDVNDQVKFDISKVGINNQETIKKLSSFIKNHKGEKVSKFKEILKKYEQERSTQQMDVDQQPTEETQDATIDEPKIRRTKKRDEIKHSLDMEEVNNKLFEAE